ncbi:hypothetical protein IAD21_00987 [Abditibacteriota bacterium]|nr:hypothetical protein IAD21_00987 [Abditibacteriota bacterium]
MTVSTIQYDYPLKLEAMLTLQCHDFPSDGDELADRLLTQANWQGEMWHIGVGGTTRIDSLRAVCCQKPDSPLLYLTHSAEFDHSLGNMAELIRNAAVDSFGLRMSFADGIKKEKWGRAFFLNEDLKLRQKGERARYFLLLSPHGWGLWRDVLAQNNRSYYYWNDGQAVFLWSRADERTWLYEASASEILARVHIQLAESKSDVGFARIVSSSSFAQRRQLVWHCKRGNTTEMERVLRWAFLAEDELWNSATNLSWRVELEENAREESYIDVDDREFLPSSLQEALAQVFAFFAPERDNEAIQQHLCLQVAVWSSSHLQIEADQPSTHERLEAFIEWRDWLATNAHALE